MAYRAEAIFSAPEPALLCASINVPPTQQSRALLVTPGFSG